MWKLIKIIRSHFCPCKQGPRITIYTFSLIDFQITRVISSPAPYSPLKSWWSYSIYGFIKARDKYSSTNMGFSSHIVHQVWEDNSISNRITSLDALSLNSTSELNTILTDPRHQHPPSQPLKQLNSRFMKFNQDTKH